MPNGLSYEEVNVLIKQQYSWLKRKYPLSYYYLETEIRLYLTGESLGLRQHLKTYSEISILRILLLKGYQMVLCIFNSLLGHLSQRVTYLNIARHPQLQKKLNKGLRQCGVEVLEYPPKYLKMFQINKYVPLGAVVNSTFKLRNLRRCVSRSGLHEFLASDKNLKKLEIVLDARVKSVAALLVQLRIKYLILQNEHCPHEKILILAAERIEAKTIIIAHGYFGIASALVTVAPIRADELIVWTPSQLEMLLKETGCNEKKVSYYGWPFETIHWNNNLPDMNPLFILTDIDSDIDEKKFLLTIEILTKFIALYPGLCIRPHPSFKLSNTYRKKLIQKKFGKHIENKTLVAQLRYSNFVTGHDSSVLVQTYFENIPTYRIKEISNREIPEVPIFSHNEVLLMGMHNPKNNPVVNSEINDGVDQVTKAILDKILVR
jgi:hypothetical protein